MVRLLSNGRISPLSPVTDSAERDSATAPHKTKELPADETPEGNIAFHSASGLQIKLKISRMSSLNTKEQGTYNSGENKHEIHPRVR